MIRGVDYSGDMIYLRWQYMAKVYGTDSLKWRIESGFYALLGQLYLANSPANS